MYELRVFRGADTLPSHIERIGSASVALDRIAPLLDEHAGCERIEVHYGGGRLFTVDCKGNTIL